MFFSMKKIIIILFVLLLFSSCTDRQESSPLPRDTEIGRLGILKGTNLVAISERRLRNLPEKFPDAPPGKVILPPGTQWLTAAHVVDQGTRVLITGRGKLDFSREVKILEGNYRGETGWVRINWIKII